MTEDDEFNKRIANTLDRSTEQLDESTLQQLWLVREHVLGSQKPNPRQWRPAIAVAAMLVLMIGFSWVTLKPSSQTVPEPAFAESYLTVEPDMLVDWEMLDAIGEVPDA